MVQNTPLRSVTERGEFSLASDIPFRLSILDSFTKSIDLDRSRVWELLNLLKFMYKTSAYLYAIAVINFKNVRSVRLATGQECMLCALGHWSSIGYMIKALLLLLLLLGCDGLHTVIRSKHIPYI